MLIVNAIVNKLTEVLAPYLKKRVIKKILDKKDKSSFVEKQSYTLEQYEVLFYFLAFKLLFILFFAHFKGTYSDYVTVFEQFGYIALFSSVYPWIAIAALANNLMELRSDAFKYCHVYNRPFPKPVKGIGPWLIAFELLGFIAVITNISLISVHPEVRNYFSDISDTNYFLIFVVAEVS